MEEPRTSAPFEAGRALPLPPRLETARLTMRPWTEADADALQEALEESVEHLARWIPWATPERPSPDRARDLLGGWIRQRTSGENCIYAVFDRADGRLVGGIGLYARIGPGRLEIGYWLRRTAAGRGYATEVTRAIVAAGFALGDVHALEIRTDPANLASRRIPEKLGFRLVETRLAAEGATRDTMIYALERTPADE